MAAGNNSFANSLATERRDLVEFVCVGFATFLATYEAGKIVSGSTRGLGKDDIEMLRLAVQSGVFIIALMTLRWVATASRSIRWLRRLLDNRSVFEGTWFEVYYSDEEIQNGERIVRRTRTPRYAVFHISYTGPKEDRYWIVGTLYYSNGLVHSEWRTGSLIFNFNDRRLEYLYTAERFAARGRIRGLGCLAFRQISPVVAGAVAESKRSVSKWPSDIRGGNGYILEEAPSVGKPLDTGASVTRSSFEFLRITSEEIEHLVPNTSSMHPDLIMPTFIRNYHDKFNEALGDGIVDPMTSDDDGRRAEPQFQLTIVQ